MSIPAYFAQRREKLLNANANSAFFIPSAPKRVRNGSVHFPYRQESSFYYLCGFDEAHSAILLIHTEEGQKSILFCEERDAKKELWEGEMYGLSRAKSVFGFDETYTYSSLEQILPTLLTGVGKLFYNLGYESTMDEKIVAALGEVKKLKGRSGKGLLDIVDYTSTLGDMRVIKQPEEIERLRKACDISARAHLELMKHTRSGMKEFELEALFEYLVRKEGCQRLGYGSIVGSGANATCLHYHKNEDTLNEGDLLLVDAGGEFDFYTADITRTYPVGLSFSSAQSDMYDLVLRAQKESLTFARPGGTLLAMYQKTCEVITQGLLDLKIIKGSLSDALEQKKYEKYYPHLASHWLGMDVHDIGVYRVDNHPKPFVPGMVFTIEPGIYVNPHDSSVNEIYRGIGIRIEDDVLITEKGHDILTHQVPKERLDIEAVRRN